MSATNVLTVTIVWCLVGLLTGVWMARRGYDPLWILLAVPLGPLFVPIAVERVRHTPALASSAALAHPHSADEPAGPRVLIGLDGSPVSEQALETVLQVLGSRCALVVLAEVVHYEAAEDEAHTDVEAASRRLDDAAARVQITGEVRTEVLAGSPGPALRQFAEQHDFDVLAVGRRGRGLSRRVLGSVSADLVTHSTIAVLVAEPKPAQ